MKKLLALLVILCVVMSSTSVSANHQHREYIDYGEVKVITIPEPDEHFKNNYLYYTHYLIFKPTVSDTYRIIINYEEDEANPYPIYLGITSYIKVNGNDFSAIFHQFLGYGHSVTAQAENSVCLLFLHRYSPLTDDDFLFGIGYDILTFTLAAQGYCQGDGSHPAKVHGRDDH